MVFLRTLKGHDRSLGPVTIMADALAQPLLGITFALLHLACMRLLARIVPQALYGTVGIGAAALHTVVAGVLYACVEAQGFLGHGGAIRAGLAFDVAAEAAGVQRTPPAIAGVDNVWPSPVQCDRPRS